MILIINSYSSFHLISLFSTTVTNIIIVTIYFEIASFGASTIIIKRFFYLILMNLKRRCVIRN